MRRSEVWLYGSRARENADAFSDTDILVIGDREDEVEAAIEGLEFPRINVSFYGWSEIEAMRTYGSLYLLHVREEGICLRQAGPGSDRLGPLLKDLPGFSRSEQDLAGFRQALEEGKLSLLEGGWPDFECEVIATVARHAAILGSYLVGQPSFGREEPFEVSCGALGYEEGRITELTAGSTAWRQHRHSEEIGDGPMWAWISLVDEFLEDLKGLVDGYARLLHSVA